MAVAVFAAVPITALLANKILESISQRIELGPQLFIPGVLAIILLSVVTIGSQILKAILANPVKALRTE